MESAMEGSTSLSTPPDQVDNLIKMVGDQNGLELAGILDDVGTPATQLPVPEST